MAKTIVAVDDGHGLNTPGKQSPDGYKENEFNHYTKEYLEIELKRCGFAVVDTSPTRKDDTLSARVKIANKENADILVSIHYNAMGGKWQSGAEGIETYFHGGSIEGKRLANLVHKHLMLGTKMNNRGVKSDKLIYENGFYILRYTDMPAILCECGFMDNREDYALMRSTTYRKECSVEICKGICEYFGMKYVPEKTMIRQKTAYEIVKEVSKYGDIWEQFIKANQSKVNLEGLIETLYYTKGK